MTASFVPSAKPNVPVIRQAPWRHRGGVVTNDRPFCTTGPVAQSIDPTDD